MSRDDRLSRRGLFSRITRPVTQSSGPAQDTSLASLSLTETSRRIAAMEVSPVEVMRAYLTRIEQYDGVVGAFATRIDPELCLEWARDAEHEIQMGRYQGRLQGLPLAVKDNHYTAGVVTRAASPILDQFVPNLDATVVARLRQAGAILVGKTNLPEWGMGPVTPGTQNPWDVNRNAGGSSGGSAAAVAADFVAGATGTDTAGSVRIPPLACGTVGLKPTYGRVSRYGIIGVAWSLDQPGPITKSVEDAALILNAIAGRDPQDRTTVASTPPDYTRRLPEGIRGWKIGIPPDSLLETYASDVQKAFQSVLHVFRQQGAAVYPVSLPATFQVGHAAVRTIRIVEAAAFHRRWLRMGASSYGVGSTAYPDLAVGSLLPASFYLQAQRVRARFVRELREMFQGIDVFVSPGRDRLPPEPESRTNAFLRSMLNLSGFPGIVVPAGFWATTPAVPLGIQIVGRPFEEESILRAAFAYEQMTDWHLMRPPL